MWSNNGTQVFNHERRRNGSAIRLLPRGLANDRIQPAKKITGRSHEFLRQADLFENHPAGVGNFPCHGLIKNFAQGVDIGSGVNRRAVFKLLLGHVKYRAENVKGMSQARLLQYPGKPEVGYFGYGSVEQYVFRFYVSVDDSGVVDGSHAVQHREKVILEPGGSSGQIGSEALSRHCVAQGRTGYVFHDQIFNGRATYLRDVVIKNLQYIGMADSGHDPHFASKPFFFRLKLFRIVFERVHEVR